MYVIHNQKAGMEEKGNRYNPLHIGICSTTYEPVYLRNQEVPFANKILIHTVKEQPLRRARL